MIEGQSNLSAYLEQIGEYALLDHSEEIALGKKVQQGDIEARNTLVNHNLRLVVNFAKKYFGRENMLDLIQEGNIGLMTAAQKYNPGMGYRFSTYAIWWIRQAIFRYLAHDRTVRLPEGINAEIMKVKRTSDTLIQMLGREPTIEEIAEEMGEINEKVRLLQESMQPIQSLDKENDRHTVRMDLIISEEDSFLGALEQKLEAENMQNIIQNLPPRELFIIERRFGVGEHSPHTLQELSDIMAISRERVRQLEVRALDRLEELLKA